MQATLLTLVGALAPVVAMFLLVYLQDRAGRVPLPRLGVIAAISLLTVPPAIALEWLAEALLGGVDVYAAGGGSLGAAAIEGFGVAALVEESIKLAFIAAFLFRRGTWPVAGHSLRVYDSIVIGVTVSLAFAGVENLLYIFVGAQTPTERFATIIVRALLSVPGHALYGVMLGAFAGRARLAWRPRERVRLLLTGLALAMLFHGLWDFFLFAMEDREGGWVALLALLALASEGLAWFTALRLIRRARPALRIVHPRAILLATRRPVFCPTCGWRATAGDRYCRGCGVLRAPRPLLPGTLSA